MPAGCILVAPFVAQCDVGGRAGSRYKVQIRDPTVAVAEVQNNRRFRNLKGNSQHTAPYPGLNTTA
jgi:hypothetical protein